MRLVEEWKRLREQITSEVYGRKLSVFSTGIIQISEKRRGWTDYLQSKVLSFALVLACACRQFLSLVSCETPLNGAMSYFCTDLDTSRKNRTCFFLHAHVSAVSIALPSSFRVAFHQRVQVLGRRTGARKALFSHVRGVASRVTKYAFTF